MERRQRAGHRRRPRARARANGHVRMRAASFDSYRAWKAFGFGVEPAAVEPAAFDPAAVEEPAAFDPAAVEEPATFDPADEGRSHSDGPSARSPDPRRHGPNRTRDVPRPHH